MIRTDAGLALGGNLSYAKWTFGYNDVNGTAGTTLALTLLENPEGGNTTTAFQIPQAGVIMFVYVHHTVPFAGTGITGMTVSLGVLGGSATAFTSAFNVFQAAANTTYQLTTGPLTTTIAAQSLTANFTSTGANLSLATAGAVDIYLCWLDVSTPSF